MLIIHGRMSKASVDRKDQNVTNTLAYAQLTNDKFKHLRKKIKIKT